MEKDAIQQENTEQRGVGTTTRTVDRLIQEFFTNSQAFVYERIDGEYNKLANEEVLRRFDSRLRSEHPRVKYITEPYEEAGIKCFKVIRLL